MSDAKYVISDFVNVSYGAYFAFYGDGTSVQNDFLILYIIVTLHKLAFIYLHSQLVAKLLLNEECRKLCLFRNIICRSDFLYI